jgi:mycoredoxin
MPANLASDIHRTEMSEPTTKMVTLFSTEWCGYCRRLKRQLAEAGIGYVEIDIDEHVEFGAPIIRATGGFRTVPSVEVDGRLLVNPTISEVVRAVADSAKKG